MHEMVKGSNVSLAALSENLGSVMVSLGWGSPSGEGDADVSVLLLGANGKVRSDADFYFYNNPVAADGSVQLLGKTPTADGNEDRISFDLTAVPADVDRIVVAASRYDGRPVRGTGRPAADAGRRAGESLLRFAIDDAGAVSAIIFGELYRRGGRVEVPGRRPGLRDRPGGPGHGLRGRHRRRRGHETETRTGRRWRRRSKPTAPAPPVPVDGDCRSPPSREAVPAPPAAGRGRGRAEASRPRRPRTAKKKVTLPKVAKKSLAENDSWRAATALPGRPRSRATASGRRGRPRCCCR